MPRCVTAGCPCGVKGKRARSQLVVAAIAALRQHREWGYSCVCGDRADDYGQYRDHRTAVVVEVVAVVAGGTDPLHPDWTEAIRLLLEPA